MKHYLFLLYGLISVNSNFGLSLQFKKEVTHGFNYLKINLKPICVGGLLTSFGFFIKKYYVQKKQAREVEKSKVEEKLFKKIIEKILKNDNFSEKLSAFKCEKYGKVAEYKSTLKKEIKNHWENLSTKESLMVLVKEDLDGDDDLSKFTGLGGDLEDFMKRIQEGMKMVSDERLKAIDSLTFENLPEESIFSDDEKDNLEKLKERICELELAMRILKSIIRQQEGAFHQVYLSIFLKNDQTNKTPGK